MFIGLSAEKDKCKSEIAKILIVFPLSCIFLKFSQTLIKTLSGQKGLDLKWITVVKQKCALLVALKTAFIMQKTMFAMQVEFR
jgi:hypothetical protein